MRMLPCEAIVRTSFICLGLLSYAPPVWSQASPYLPLDHWAGPYIEYLIRARVINDPAPLTRPLKRQSIAKALLLVDTAGASSDTRALVHRLRAEFLPLSEDSAHYRIDFFADAGLLSQGRRDPMRPGGPGGIESRGGASAWAVWGPFALSQRTRWDSRLVDDPDWKGIRHGPLAGRLDDAYLSFQKGAIEITFGNLDRNWGSASLPGLLISNVPYSYEHLFVSVETPVFGIQSLVSQLDDVTDPAGVTHQRYWIAHRAVFRPWSWMQLWVNQATLLSGPNRQLEFWALNPLRLGNFSAEDENREAGTNVFLEGVVRLAPKDMPVLTAALLIDDLQLFSGDALPNRLGASVTVEGRLNGRTTWEVLYTAVSSLAYRTFRIPEAALRRNVGVARNFSDYDQIGLRLSTLLPMSTLAGVEAALLRQGEGDIRKPFPLPEEFAATPLIFEGVVERTWRGAVLLDMAPAAGLHIHGSAGLHLLQNADHVAGANATRFVGDLTISYVLPLWLAVP